MTGNDAGDALAAQGYGATLWTPDEKTISDARVSHYLRWLAGRGVRLPEGDYRALWEWSVNRPGEFWDSVWDYFDVLGDRGDGPALAEESMPGARWFPGATLNYARNALRAADTDPDRPAIIAHSERGRAASLTYRQLASEVSRVAAGLRALGVTRGDRVVALLPNIPEAVVALLATASIGAIWSSCSPDFGTRSVVDRFAQIDPKVLIAVDGYTYNGKEFDRTATVSEIAAELPSLKAVITVDLIGTGTRPSVPNGVGLVPWGGDDRAGEGDNSNRKGDNSNKRVTGEGELEFEEVPFDHPLWVVYSSGTTGLPKPIMHGHGGIVLEHLKSLAFHLDLGPADRFTWHTTTGWMMWNFLVGGLLTGTTIVVYDGSATYPGTGRLWQLAEEEKLTYLGVGAPYLMACHKAGLEPGKERDLASLRGVGSTGSPLPPEGFDWVYRAVGDHVLLGSMSGGTDVCTGFVGASPLLEVRRGMISGRSLGVKAEAFTGDGTPVTGEVGELVITAPMPSMPIGFWNDDSGERYSGSYFTDFPGVWRHGDWIEILPDGGCVIFGRSDATLNRGGVRMGTSEFYRVVEAFDEIADSLVVDTGRLGAEGKLVLFVQLAPGATLDDDLIKRIGAALRKQLSPRHVPDEIRDVPGVPRTLSGKKLEIPVRKILLGTPVSEAADPSALANPEVLGSYAPGPRL
ncbi:MAG: acetoacetate--CoA ligase [Nocardiopsaceae bacterium]|nr:acetoacetate--CoA ligase [Nocardiopsaceae bacterium]